MNLLVVNFHYYREEKYPSGIYPLNEQQFRQQLSALSAHYTFIGQSTLLNWVVSKQVPDGNFCLITFDDGLKEQMAAFKLMKSLNVPAIFFIPTGPLMTHKTLDVHKLHYIRANIQDDMLYHKLSDITDIARYTFDEVALANQYRYDTLEGQKIKYYLNFVLNGAQKDRLINDVFNTLVPDEAAFSEELYMNDNDLQVLAQAGALGAHGHEHIPLAVQPFDHAVADIRQSVNYLEQVTGAQIVSFSYPYGGEAAVNSSLFNAFTQTSVQLAFTMWRGVNRDEDLNNPLFFKRIDTNDAPGGKSGSVHFTPPFS